MMIEEYRRKLNELSDDELEGFRGRFGGEWRTREDYVREYARDPQHEKIARDGIQKP